MLGSLSDIFGRKPMFIIEMVIFTVFLALACFCTNYIELVICLLGIGLALGCDYPTAHVIISESIPSTARGRLVLGAFAFQAVGILAGTAVGFLVLSAIGDLSAWRWMFATAIIPAVIVTVGRFFIIESANWLWAKGDHAKAVEATRKLLVRTPQYPSEINLAHRDAAADAAQGKQKLRRVVQPPEYPATILASVLRGSCRTSATYGIGIFTPTILAAAFGANGDKVRSVTDVIASAVMAAKGAALTNSLLIVGIIFAVLLADTLGRIKLQVFGFVGCAVGLLLASIGKRHHRRRLDGDDLCRLHAVQFHDRSWPECADLPAGRRSVSDGDPRRRAPALPRPSPRSARSPRRSCSRFCSGRSARRRCSTA